MAYNSNTPLANEAVSTTQQPIHDNFSDIETFLNVNHVGFNVANQGKHKFVTMPVQGATPVPLANEVNLFSRTSVFTTDPELCLARSDGSVIEMTSSLQNVTGWAFTSSGMLLKWGGDVANAVLTNIVYPAGPTIPAFSAVFNVMITVVYPTGLDENTNVTLINFTNPLQFSVVGTRRTSTAPPAAPVSFLYLATGVM